MDEFLHQIEESLADFRHQLEPLAAGVIRTAEISDDGKQVDTTEARVLWLKRQIAQYEAIAVKLRAERRKA